MLLFAWQHFDLCNAAWASSHGDPDPKSTNRLPERAALLSEATLSEATYVSPANCVLEFGVGNQERPFRVLVVDDIEHNRDLLIRRLERKGFVTASADDGFSALEALSREEFDVVLLGIMMPNLNERLTSLR